MTTEQMKTVANDVFKRYPTAKSVFVTSDSQAFFDEAHAKNHAAKNRTGKELKVEKFLRETEKAENKSVKKNSKEAIAEIQTAETLEAVTALLEAEKAGDNRKTVIDAAEKRIKELENKE